MRRIAGSSSLLVLAVACSSGQSATQEAASSSLRLPPIAIRAQGGADVSALFDRDATTSLHLDSTISVELTFAHEVDPRALKVAGARGLSVSIEGAGSPSLDSNEGWQVARLGAREKRAHWTLTLSPQEPGASVSEVELWGVGAGKAPRDAAALAAASVGGAEVAYDDVLVVRSPSGSVALDRDAGRPCASFDFAAALPPRSVHRAFLAYEAAGVQRPIVLRRALNGAAAVGGLWLAGGNRERSVVDEVDPAKLSGQDSIELCLPDLATQSIFVSEPRLLLQLDDGTNLLDRDAETRVGQAFDARPGTVERLAGLLSLSFEREVELDSAAIQLAEASVRATVRASAADPQAAPMRLKLGPGWNRLGIAPAVARGIEIDVAGGGSADVVEIALAGSPSGRPTSAPRIVVAYPRLRYADGRYVGERFGDRAFVAGWAESPAGPGEVSAEGAPIGTGGGAFSSALTRPATAGDSWRVTLTARFPDGTTVSRDVFLDDDRQGDLDEESGLEVAGLDDDARFGRLDETGSVTLDPQAGGVARLGSDVEFEAPAGAVNGRTAIGINRKRQEAVPPLDAGMINVTAPRGAGYRFTPEGQKFLAPVSITLPYDAALLPEGMGPEQIQTFFYDDATESWQPLLARRLDRTRGRIVSETTHFTFMINAVLVAPDHPGPVSFNPTSIKDLKSAEPSAGIDFIEPPQPNSQGTARVAVPLRLPAARGAYKPSLALTYDSQGPNGWTGVGWDLRLPSVEVDTKFGVPYYDGSERYTLEGQELVPVGSASCVDGGTGRRYAARAEGAFDLIVRCGSDSTNWHFERVDRSGVLYVFGVSPEARVASARTGDVAAWRLERVIDPNGNLCRYVYALDQKQAIGTAFDQQSGEDFRQSYLTQILYTGKAARLGPGALDANSDSEAGAYAVVFLRRQDFAGNFADRDDIVVSARTGFKVVTRHLLDRVQVWVVGGRDADRGIVREYALAYEPGDFRKTRLASVEVFGRGGQVEGASFYSHRFSYTSAAGGFGPPVPWTFADGPDGSAISSSHEKMVGTHAFAGIGFGMMRSSGSVGFKVGYAHRDSRTEAQLLDLNGDGLPDRVVDRNGTLTVLFNQQQTLPGAAGAPPALSALAPPGDPLHGAALFPFGVPFASLSAESGDNLNFSVQGVFGPFSANAGGSFNWSTSDRFLMDVDGDGLPDYVEGGSALFNYPRTCSGAGCCPAGQFCFGTEKPVGSAVSLANLAGSVSGDPSLLAARQAVDDHTPPSDAMVEWTAPYAGVVDLSGAMTWLHLPPVGPGHDGVRVRVYLAHADGSMDTPDHPLVEVHKAAADAGSTPVTAGGIPVAQGDHVYFVLSTLRDFPVGVDASTTPPTPVPLEDVGYSPSIRYSVGAAEQALTDPTGAPLFQFDRGSDFRLAGGPLVVTHAAFGGTIHVEGSVTKSAATSDDVRVCVQRTPAGSTSLDVPCGSSADVGFLPLPSATTGTFAFPLDVSVSAGDQLVFRIDSDLSFDPGAVSWAPSGSMTSVCSSPGSCHAPTDTEAAGLRFSADPYVKVHPSLTDELKGPYVVPFAGTLDVSSSASELSFGVTFAVRSRKGLFLKHGAGQSASASIPVNAGDQIWIEAHSETGIGPAGWTVEAFLNGAPVTLPMQATFDPPLTPFGGGHHGWRYGTWGGRDSDAFDPTIFYRPDDTTFSGVTEHDRFLDGKRKARDPNSSLSQRSRLFAPLVPRSAGTRMNGTPGLAPEPAFVTQDGTCFATALSMHGGKRGGFSATGNETLSSSALFSMGDLSRASEGKTISAGLGINLGVSASVNVSSGSSTQKVDVRDMNGDGVVDVATDGSGVRLTDPATLGPRAVPARLRSGAPFALQTSSDVSFSVGLGYSEPFRIEDSEGEVRGVSAMYPTGTFGIGGGLGANLSAVERELVDVNGDGLPDQVRMEDGKLLVRLNLGTSFAENEDVIADARWGTTGTFDLLAERLGGGVADADVGDDEEAAGQETALGILDELSSPNVVRRTTAVTIEGSGNANVGISNGGGGASFVREEEFGVSANYESSLNSTSVMLVDVTGDGLPDYVRRSPGESFFTVKVNLGGRFGPDQRWPVAAWPVQKPQLRLPIGPVQQVVNDLGFGGGADGIEATAINSVVPSVGFVASVTIPIPLAFTPWLIFSGGADVSPNKLSGFELSLMDIDGDGLPDHVLKIEGGNGSSQAAVWARLNRNGGGNLLSRVEEPLGGSFEMTYARQGNTVEMPESRWVMTGLAVHDGLESGTGHDLLSTFTYRGGHHDRAERAFFGFGSVETLRPDGSLMVQRYRNDAYRSRDLLVSEELRDASGALFTATANLYDDQPALISAAAEECRAATPFFLSGDDYCSAAWVRLQRTEHRFYEGLTADASQARITTAQTYGYDLASGNVVAFEDLGDLADPGDDFSASVDYLKSGAAAQLHAIDRPTHVQVFAGPAARRGALLRERSGSFDANGNLTELVSSLGGGAVAVTSLDWNADGQLARYRAPPNARGDRYAVSYGYDDATRQFVVSSSDSFGYTSSAEYDIAFGEVVGTRDQNGNVEVRQLDRFGRLTALFGPYDPPARGVPTVGISYAIGAHPAFALSANKLAQPKRDGSTTLDNVVFMDGFRRVVQARADAEVRGVIGATASGRIEYDAMGRVAVQGQVTFPSAAKTSYVVASAKNPTVFVHDVLGRNVLVTQPDGSVTATAYGFGQAAGDRTLRFRTAITDAEGRLHVSFLDGAQRVVAVEERIEGRVPTTRYLYDPLAQLQTVIDAAGNRTEVRYDLGGRTVSLSTPDAGLTEYAYDPAGNLIAKVDPNLRNARLSLRYDYEFNRLVRVSRPISGDVTFEYGPPGAPENAAGRITRIVDEAGQETRGYGRLGETVRTTRTVIPLRPGDAARTYQTLFSSDSFGRMLEMVYPDGEILTYGYDGGGLLISAIGSRPQQPHGEAGRETYLASVQYDEFGQRVRAVLGNGVVSRYAYDDRTRRLAALNTVTPLQRTLQANTYAYDRVGNVLGIANGLAPATHHRSGPVSMHYQYDALDRLVSAQGTAEARPGVIDRFNSTFAYSDIHNLTRNAQVRQIVEGSGQGEFPPHSNHDIDSHYDGSAPHQATRIGDLKITYDANGNTSVQCRAGLGICAGTASVDVTGLPASHDHWRRYDWTEENRLRQVVSGGGNTTRFLYDAQGERVVEFGRGTPSVTIGQFFTVQGGHHATKHVFAGTERVSSKLIPVPEEVALWQQGTAATGGCFTSGCALFAAGPKTVPLREETYYYHADHVGSTSWMTDHEGKVHEHVEYFPYGEVWRDSRLDDDPGPQPRTPAYLFTSKEFDPETRLYYYGARYYDGSTATWKSPDPAITDYLKGLPAQGVFRPANLSPYAYSWQNPVTYRDPSGAFPVRAYPTSPPNLATHQRITERALTGRFSAQALQQVIRANVAVDNDQGTAPASQAKHAMRNEHQDPADAIRMRENLVRDEINATVKAINEGRVADARASFGRATHPVQDNDATAHTDDQGQPLVWRGIYHPVDAKEHIDIDMAERLEGVRARRAIADTQAAFDNLRRLVLGDHPTPETIRKWQTFTGIEEH